MGTFTGTIKEMNPGQFWSDPHALGLSDSDLELATLRPDEIPQLPRERIERAVFAAFKALDAAPVGQPMPFDPDEIFEGPAGGKPS